MACFDTVDKSLDDVWGGGGFDFLPFVVLQSLFSSTDPVFVHAFVEVDYQRPSGSPDAQQQADIGVTAGLSRSMNSPGGPVRELDDRLERIVGVHFHAVVGIGTDSFVIGSQSAAQGFYRTANECGEVKNVRTEVTHGPLAPGF